MYKSHDPIADLRMYQEDEARWLESRPKCSECGEPIQDESAFFYNDEWICEDCMMSFRKWVED